MNDREKAKADRDRERAISHARALSDLRKRYRLRTAGAHKYDALCPAHDDHNRSLRVYVDPASGAMHFRCYAGCHFNEVRKALRLPEFKTAGGAPAPRRLLPQRRAPRERPAGCPEYDFPALAELFRCEPGNLPSVAPLAAELGCSAAALHDAGVGLVDGYDMWSEARRPAPGPIKVRAWSFPMVDAALDVTGLRLRSDRGAKFSWTTSAPGLFAGRRWTGAGPIVVPEGPTDRLAFFDWGYDAVAKPSCNDGDDLVEAFLLSIRGLTRKQRPVVIASNLDERKDHKNSEGEVTGHFYPGQDGARALADALVRRWAAPIYVMTAPAGCKDFRDWLKLGATRADVERLIGSRRPWQPTNRRTA